MLIYIYILRCLANQNQLFKKLSHKSWDFGTVKLGWLKTQTLKYLGGRAMDYNPKWLNLKFFIYEVLTLLR